MSHSKNMLFISPIYGSYVRMDWMDQLRPVPSQYGARLQEIVNSSQSEPVGGSISTTKPVIFTFLN